MEAQATDPTENVTPTVHVFHLSTRMEEKAIEGRNEAVQFAKDWSLEDGQSVAVERADGRVKMTFRDGGLVDYVFETRKGRKA